MKSVIVDLLAGSDLPADPLKNRSGRPWSIETSSFQ